MAQDMDWDDIANMWWNHFEHMETDPTSRAHIKRGRSRSRTPSVRKRADRAPSRAKGMQPRKLTFSSARTRSRSRSASQPRKKVAWGKAAFYAANKGKLPTVIEKAWRKTRQGKRNQATLDRLLNLSKVRHNLTRKDARKTMPRGKPYTRRTMRRPKGAYRGAVMPKWAKGETKHVLITDNNQAVSPETCHASVGNPLDSATGGSDETQLDIGELKAWSLNPMLQGTSSVTRNGRSVDGTYLRIQGHIRNGSSTVKSYVRMLVLAVKGGADNSTAGKMSAEFKPSNMFKKIDGSVVGWDSGTTNQVSGAKRVRSLQLPVNRSLYTVLADQKFQLAHNQESFGSSDRLFDLKMKLKQRTTFADGSDSSSFEKNQLVFVVYTANPTCLDTLESNVIPIEFESKYSYKDF